MTICSLYRNDELFRLLKEKCAEEAPVCPLDNTQGNCRYVEGSNETSYIQIDSYANGQDLILEFESKNVVKGLDPKLKKRDLIPQPTRVRMFVGNECKLDGSHVRNVPGYRICDDIGQFQTIMDSLEHYLGTPLPIDHLEKQFREGDEKFFKYLPELSGVPLNMMQRHPTHVVREFAKGIDGKQPLEGIMKEFHERFRKPLSYPKTPFAYMPVNHGERFVCKRTAHEILTTFKFSCGDFASVFMAVLTALGKDSRIVKTVTNDFKYGMYGGHDFVEFFDPQERRWILTDPTGGKVYRNYSSEKAFNTSHGGWIRMGSWDSNWGAGCLSLMDITQMRAKTINDHQFSEYFFDLEQPVCNMPTTASESSK